MMINIKHAWCPHPQTKWVLYMPQPYINYEHSIKRGSGRGLQVEKHNLSYKLIHDNAVKAHIQLKR